MLDENFPVRQFLTAEFTLPYRMDRNANVGGIALYVREDIPSSKTFLKPMRKI